MDNTAVRQDVFVHRHPVVLHMVGLDERVASQLKDVHVTAAVVT